LLTLPIRMFDALGLHRDEWLRLTVLGPHRTLLERVPPWDPPCVGEGSRSGGGHLPSEGADRSAPRQTAVALPGGRRSSSEEAVVMIQVYTAVRSQQRVCIPEEVTDVMDVDGGDWVRVTLLPGGRALVEPAPHRIPDPVTLDTE
jgi:hypothetical protein